MIVSVTHTDTLALVVFYTMATMLLLFGEVATRAHYRAMTTRNASDYTWSMMLCNVVDTFKGIRDIVAQEISKGHE